MRSGFRLAVIFVALMRAAPAVFASGEEAAFDVERVDFLTRILPVLTKSGCNAGACHGAAVGQGGFRLSLLGYDPERDYEIITREFSGRRIDFAVPEESLLLRKPAREVRHRGGLKLERETEPYDRVAAWIRAGVPYQSGDLRVTGIDVTIREALDLKIGEEISLGVRAALSDGTSEDVTATALYDANDDGIAEVSATGKVLMRGRGVTTIMIRYLGQVASVRVGVPFQDAELVELDFPARNFIDEIVGAELRRLRLPPSELADGGQFLRRIHLDVAGRLPTPEEAREFLNGADSREWREEWIERLIDSEEFVDYWTLKLSDLLLISSRRLGAKPAQTYHGWVRAQLARNTPIDRMARELLVAEGDPSIHGAANFHRLTRDPRDMGEFVGRALLGVQLSCARCHAHPFDRWTQDDYFPFAAYFARTDYDGARVYVKDRGEVQHPKTNRDVMPEPLGGGPSRNRVDEDRRAALAEWITLEENPMLARSFANRVWKHLMGRGLVEPVDDLRETNPASIPALLEALADDFRTHEYDLRHLVRTIAASRAYQLSSSANDLNRTDEQFFSRAYLKPLAGPVLADAVARVLGTFPDYPGYPSGTRAVQLVDAETPSYTLDVFGRCRRESTCETESQFGGGLSQALHFLTGQPVNDGLRFGEWNRLLKQSPTDRALVEELYLRSLSRFPSDAELAFCAGVLKRSESREAAARDLLWALLNSREFAYNH
jgi:hypothetical protein